MSTNSATLTLYPPSPHPPATPPNITSDNFLWTEQRIRAVNLLADGRYSDLEIAQMVGTTTHTLNSWKQYPQFSQRLDTILEEYKQKVLSTSIAVKINRIHSLAQRHYSLQQIVSQRSSSIDPSSLFYNEDFLSVPGMDSGFILPKYRSIKIGPHSYRLVLDAEVDTTLLNEFRRIEEQAAKETGQWAEVHNVNILQKAYIGIDINQV